MKKLIVLLLLISNIVLAGDKTPQKDLGQRRAREDSTDKKDHMPVPFQNSGNALSSQERDSSEEADLQDDDEQNNHAVAAAAAAAAAPAPAPAPVYHVPRAPRIEMGLGDADRPVLRVIDLNGNQDMAIYMIVPGDIADNILNDVTVRDFGDQRVDIERQVMVMAQDLGQINYQFYVSATRNGINSSLTRRNRDLRQGVESRLTNPIRQQGGARAYRLFVGVHVDQMGELLGQLSRLLGATGQYGLHGRTVPLGRREIGARVGIMPTPATAMPGSGVRRTLVLSEGAEMLRPVTEQLEFHWQRGVYLITEPGINFQPIPIIDLGGVALNDEQIIFLFGRLNQDLQAALGDRFRYVGQVGGGTNGLRTLIDRAIEHREGGLERPNSRLYRQAAQINQDTGLALSFHALFHNVAPQDLNLIEALTIEMVGRLTQRVMNSNAAHGSERLNQILLELRHGIQPTRQVPAVARALVFGGGC